MYKAVAVVQDESSHWYVIPIEMKEEFYRLQNEWLKSKEDYDLMDNFYKKFSLCRTGGDLNNVQLYIKLT